MLRQTTLTRSAAIAPRKAVPDCSDGFLFVDLFCSIGGVSVAAAEMGHSVVLGVDFDPNRLAVHACNHPTARHECFALGPKTEAALVALIDSVVPYDQRHRLWVHLSPPCQGQSSLRAVGKRTRGKNKEETTAEQMHEHKQMGLGLVQWSMDFVRRLAPAQFSIEEVSDAKGCVYRLMHAMRLAHPEILDFELFEMKVYGVPQTRERLICGRPETIERLRHEPRYRAQSLSIGEVLRPPTGTRFLQGMMSKPVAIDKVRPATRLPGRHTDGFNLFYEMGVVAPTCASVPFSWVADHPYERIRRLTPAEMGALQTFPPDFKWPAAATRTLKYEGYGNAVPPLFMSKMILAAGGRSAATTVQAVQHCSQFESPPSSPTPPSQDPAPVFPACDCPDSPSLALLDL